MVHAGSIEVSCLLFLMNNAKNLEFKKGLVSIYLYFNGNLANPNMWRSMFPNKLTTTESDAADLHLHGTP